MEWGYSRAWEAFRIAEDLLRGAKDGQTHFVLGARGRRISLGGIALSREAAAEAEQALRLRPELAERPRDFVSKIIHNPNVQELMVDALQTAEMPG